MTDTRIQATAAVLAYSEKVTGLTEAQQKHVTSGDIAIKVDEVAISAKSAPDEKEHYVTFAEVSARKMAGVLALANGLVDKDDPSMASGEAVLLALFNRAYDAQKRALVRQKLNAEVQGPEKKFESAAKTLAKTGLFSYETALAAVKAAAANVQK